MGGGQENAGKDMSRYKDLEVWKNVAHSGNSEKFNVLVTVIERQWLQQDRSFSPCPPSHGKVRREAVRADMVARLREFFRDQALASSPHIPGMWVLTSWPKMAVRVPAIAPTFQAMAWRKR